MNRYYNLYFYQRWTGDRTAQGDLKNSSNPETPKTSDNLFFMLIQNCGTTTKFQISKRKKY